MLGALPRFSLSHCTAVSERARKSQIKCMIEPHHALENHRSHLLDLQSSRLFSLAFSRYLHLYSLQPDSKNSIHQDGQKTRSPLGLH